MKAEQRDALLAALQARFEKHMARHPGIDWPQVLQRLRERPAALKALDAMEATGGEPDVIGHEAGSGAYLFCDCAAESPPGRRSLCYDDAALASRKENKPKGSALAMAAQMGVQLLDEAQYRHLQTLGSFDTKTSSWVSAPAEVRTLGGALFCDRRFGRVFVYHNGAESYYAARGFRGLLRV
jgi:hypothetical protein